MCHARPTHALVHARPHGAKRGDEEQRARQEESERARAEGDGHVRTRTDSMWPLPTKKARTALSFRSTYRLLSLSRSFSRSPHTPLPVL